MEDAQALEIQTGSNQLESCPVRGCSFQGTKLSMSNHVKLAIHQVGGETNLGGSSSRKFTSETGPVCLEL